MNNLVENMNITYNNLIEIHEKLREIFYMKMHDDFIKDDMIHIDNVSDVFDETICEFFLKNNIKDDKN